MLEGLYWTKDSQANTPGSYQDYLTRYADGPHAASASKGIEDLQRAEDDAKENQRFQEASNSSDEATLRAFLKDHPAGPQHDQIYGRLADVIWDRTDKNDEKSISAYLKEFNSGRRAQDAQKQLASLVPRKAPQLPQQQTPEPPPVDERRAVLAVLDQYKRAYESQSVEELKNVWPGISDRAARGMQTLFKTASSLRLDYGRPEPQIAGDVATISFVQTMSYVQDRKPVKAPPAKVIMQLRKQSSGVWVIESIR